MLATVEERFLQGQAKMQAGDAVGAKASFDSAVDLILSSGIDLRSNPRLKSIFDQLFSQLYQLETAPPAGVKDEEREPDKAKETVPEQKYEPAVKDELEAVNVYPISIEPGLQHLVEEDIANTRYDIPVIVNEDVLRWLEYYKTRGRKIMELGLRRIGLYRDMIHQVFQESGIPKDLIYIAQQESMFKPNARSRASAKGMWQFVYSTGKRYGLTQNWWIDEKLDPEKSTRAAAEHLSKLYEMFGDWYLVMAAYNSGEYGIQRITEKTRIRDFWDLADRKLLHKETVSYVPSILATMIISKHPDRYGFDVEPLPAVTYKRVQIPSPVDLSVVAQAVGRGLDEIKDLNPALRRMVTPANQKLFEINLPLDVDEGSLKSLAAMPVEKRVRWRTHVIEEGDSLWLLSRHYHVSVEMIMDANNLSSSRLRIGRELLIPPVIGPSRLTASAQAKKPAAPSPRPTVPLAKSATSSGLPSKGEIQISVSDGRNGSGARAGENGDSSHGPADAVMAKQIPSKTSVLQSDTNGSEKRVIHTVRRGDSLYEIARRYKTSVAQVRAWNGLKGNLLHPGDTLQIFLPR